MFYIHSCLDMPVGLPVSRIFSFFSRHCGVGCYHEFIFSLVDLNFTISQPGKLRSFLYFMTFETDRLTLTGRSTDVSLDEMKN